MQLSLSLGSRPRRGRIQQPNRAPAGAPLPLGTPAVRGDRGQMGRLAGKLYLGWLPASLRPRLPTALSVPGGGLHLPSASFFYQLGFSPCSALPAPALPRLTATKPLAFPKNCSRCNFQLEQSRNRKEGTAPRRTPGGCLPGAN